MSTFAGAAALVAAWIGAALVLAYRQRRRFLWRRAVAIAVIVYAAGALGGLWAWNQGRPAADYVTHSITRWLGG